MFQFIYWINRFLYYDLERFACVRIPTQIQINITEVFLQTPQDLRFFSEKSKIVENWQEWAL